MKNKTQNKFITELPKRSDFPENSFLLFDQELEKINPRLQQLIKAFQYRMAVPSGEKLKSLESFLKWTQTFASLTSPISSRKMTLVVLGGGTLTDFGGFLASVYKRGVRLVLIPSTWLSAVDSAHGGKNGLNLSSLKNQIGTFYFPAQVWMSKPILRTQDAGLQKMALSELIKVFLVSDSAQWKKLSSSRKIDLWTWLKPAVTAKLKVVAKDPFESLKIRQWLNFGHTLAHVLEVELGWAHGKAVLYGIVFDLIWSRYSGYLSHKDFEKIIQGKLWADLVQPEDYVDIFNLNPERILSLIRQDKKINSKGLIEYVFLKKAGMAQVVSLDPHELLSEFQRQKDLLFQ